MTRLKKLSINLRGGMFKKIKKWVEEQWVTFLMAQQEIKDLKEERDFWEKECRIILDKYSILNITSFKMELINIESFIGKKSSKSCPVRKVSSIKPK